MNASACTGEVEIRHSFHDVDMMQVAWHGHYLKYFELARGVLLDRIGYNYREMQQSGYLWPVIEVHVRYPGRTVTASACACRRCSTNGRTGSRISYLLTDVESGRRLTTGHTVQVAVHIASARCNSPRRLCCAKDCKPRHDAANHCLRPAGDACFNDAGRHAAGCAVEACGKAHGQGRLHPGKNRARASQTPAVHRHAGVLHAQGVLLSMQTPASSELVMSDTTIVQRTSGKATRLRLGGSPYAAVASVFSHLASGDAARLLTTFTVESIDSDGMAWTLRLRPRNRKLQAMLLQVSLAGDEYLREIQIEDERAPEPPCAGAGPIHL